MNAFNQLIETSVILTCFLPSAICLKEQDWISNFTKLIHLFGLEWSNYKGKIKFLQLKQWTAPYDICITWADICMYFIIKQNWHITGFYY